MELESFSNDEDIRSFGRELIHGVLDDLAYTAPDMWASETNFIVKPLQLFDSELYRGQEFSILFCIVITKSKPLKQGRIVRRDRLDYGDIARLES